MFIISDIYLVDFFFFASLSMDDVLLLVILLSYYPTVRLVVVLCKGRMDFRNLLHGRV